MLYCFDCVSLLFAHSIARLRGQLLKISHLDINPCKEVKHEHILEMKRVIEQAQLRLNAKKGKNTSLPTPTTMATTKVAKKRRGGGGTP